MWRLRVAEPVDDPYRHVTRTGQYPRVVRGPTFHVQLTRPVLDAVLRPRPAAVDGPDL